MMRVGATEVRYERGLQPLPKIGPWQDRLDALLRANEVKTQRIVGDSLKAEIAETQARSIK